MEYNQNEIANRIKNLLRDRIDDDDYGDGYIGGGPIRRAIEQGKYKQCAISSKLEKAGERNAWIKHVYKKACELDIPYGQALADPRVRCSYVKETKPRRRKRKRRKKKKGGMYDDYYMDEYSIDEGGYGTKKGAARNDYIQYGIKHGTYKGYVKKKDRRPTIKDTAEAIRKANPGLTVKESREMARRALGR